MSIKLSEARRMFSTGTFVSTQRAVQFKDVRIPRGTKGRVLEVKTNRWRGYDSDIEVTVLFPDIGAYYLEHTDLRVSKFNRKLTEQFLEEMRVDVYDDEEKHAGSVTLPKLIAQAIQNSGWSARIGKVEIGMAGQALGRMGGRAKSSRKASASRANGKKGGRPPVKGPKDETARSESKSRVNAFNEKLKAALKKSSAK